MFRPLSFYIGLRYTRAKRRNHFISFIAMMSMLGIILGVMVLITVLSVMNGFDYQIQKRIFGMASHVTITEYAGLQDWSTLEKRIDSKPEVVASAPFVSGQGMLTHLGLVRTAMVQGIDPTLQAGVSNVGKKMIKGTMQALKSGQFGIVLGAQLAESLGLNLGDKVILATPKVSVGLIGIVPDFRQFKVVGIFQVGNGFGFDSRLAFINIQDAQRLYRMKDKVTGLRLRLTSLYEAPKLASQLIQHLPAKYEVTNWTQQYGSLFKAIRMEKTMMFLMLLLIIAVAAFNLVSSLVMSVTDKQSDIAILRTLGATPRTIMGIFIVQGTVIGCVGTLIGVILGVVLAWNITDWFSAVERLLHVQLLSSNVYYVNFLPSKLQWSDVLHTCIIALLLCIVATIYPAWRASRIQPAEALRYE